MSTSGAEISTREIYDEVRSISTKLDHLSTRFDAVVKDQDDHERRIRILERRLWLATGASAVLAGGAVQVINAVVGG